MTAVLANEIATLQSLWRGLCLSKTHFSAITKGSCRFPTCSLQPGTLSVYHTLPTSIQGGSTVRRLSTPCGSCWILDKPLLQVLSSAYIQQQRFYAKAAAPTRKPLSFDYSGDLATQSPLNPTELHKDFQEFSELNDAPESVQKLCTIDFATGEDKLQHRKDEMRERIIKLFGPGADREMRVALLTVEIRNLIPHVVSIRKDKKSKSQLVEKIQMRKKILKFLRREDYQRFIWLLRELRIRYVLPPDYCRQETRKVKRKQEVFLAADALRKKKIADLKAQLDAEREEFMKYKEETLKRIEVDIEKYNLDRASFEEKLKRQRVPRKTYPRIYTWEERQKMAEELAMK